MPKLCYGAFFMGHGLLQVALESGNHLMKTQIPEIMCEKREVVVESDQKLEKITWHVDDVTICKPTVREDDGAVRLVLPDEARLRKFTYACTINLSFTYTEYKRDSVNAEYAAVRKIRHQNKPFCKFPVMVRSFFCNTVDIPEFDKECRLDNGGYFIINGTEKAIIMQQKVRTNVPYVRVMPQNNRFSHMCEIRALSETKMRSTSTLYIYITRQRGGSPPHVFVQMPFITMQIPLCLMFRLLRVETKNEMMKYVIGDSKSTCDNTLTHLVSCVMDDNTLSTLDMSHEELIQLIGKKGTNQATIDGRSRRVQHTVANEFLPHMGLSSTPDILIRKASYFGYAIRKLLLVYIGRLPVDNYDDYCNKRIESPGMLLGLLYRQLYRNYLKMLQMTLRKVLEASKRINPMTLLNFKKLTNQSSISLGHGKIGDCRKGAHHKPESPQVLSRITYVGTISHLRRVNTPISREGKRPEPRQVIYIFLFSSSNY